MSYILATTENVRRFYVFEANKSDYTLTDKLDPRIIPMAADIATAKQWAKDS
jgi:hypothetical protein